MSVPFFPSAFLAANSTAVSDPSTITNHPLALIVWIGVGVLGLAAGAIAVTSSERRLRSSGLTSASNGTSTSGVTIVAAKKPLASEPAPTAPLHPSHSHTPTTSLIDSESGLLSVG